MLPFSSVADVTAWWNATRVAGVNGAGILVDFGGGVYRREIYLSGARWIRGFPAQAPLG